jgi:nicotinamide-nucleotide adenylyltransferase
VEHLAAVKSLTDIYTGNFTNTPVPRDKHDAPTHLHLVAGVFVYNPATRMFLVQQRSAAKAVFPEHFTDSASGHINARAGMTLDTIKVEMCRELAEEMGVVATPGQLSLWTMFQDPAVNEIKFIFAASVASSTTRLDLGEVTSRSGWYSAARLRELLKAERFVTPVIGLWDVLLQQEDRFDAFLAGLAAWQTYWRWCDGFLAYQQWSSTNQAIKGGREKIPLYLGRFQPFHLGHLECLRRIRKQSPVVIIGIGSAQYSRDARNPLTFEERRALILHVLEQVKLGFSNVFIVPIPDIHNEHLWMQNIKLLLGNSIRVYSNNEWVRGLANAGGIETAERFEFDMGSYNGSRVRELIAVDGNWQRLVPNPRYMVNHGLVEIIKQSKK